MEYINLTPYNSFEFGKANQRHKIYYQCEKELIEKLLKLKNLRLTDLELDLNTYKEYMTQETQEKNL